MTVGTKATVHQHFASTVHQPSPPSTKATQRPTARPLSLPIHPLDTRPRAPAATRPRRLPRLVSEFLSVRRCQSDEAFREGGAPSTGFLQLCEDPPRRVLLTPLPSVQEPGLNPPIPNRARPQLPRQKPISEEGDPLLRFRQLRSLDLHPSGPLGGTCDHSLRP